MIDLNTLPKTREEAFQVGSMFYFTGKPCKKGHFSERYTKTYNCLTCCNESQEKYQQTGARKGYYKEYQQTTYYKESRKKYRQTDSFKESQKKSLKKYRKNNITYIFTRDVLRRLLNRKSTGIKVHQIDELLEYSASQLRAHLESQFKEGMSWDNWGEWHVDHIKPVAQFKREGITDPKIINALSNLQPLWAEENLKKSDKMLDEGL